MATPPESPGPEEALFEFENSRARHQATRPVPIEDLLRQTKFSRQEIRVMYRGFKQVISIINIFSENLIEYKISMNIYFETMMEKSGYKKFSLKRGGFLFVRR